MSTTPETGIVIDVETTGLSPNHDKIIEIGILEFIYDVSEPIPTIISTYGALEDPLERLSGNTKQITGITDKAVSGRKIEWDKVQDYIDRASVIIAHNAKFDRGFLIKRPELRNLEDKLWCCTMDHIDWKGKGFGTKKLDYLAAEHGFLNGFAHRAVFDCATTFRIMLPYFEDLVINSQKQHIKIMAINSPFETKDILKARGYKWNAGIEGNTDMLPGRYWWTVVAEDKLDEERTFLQEHVYVNIPDAHEEMNA